MNIKNNEVYEEIKTISRLLEVEKEAGKSFEELFCLYPEEELSKEYILKLKIELEKWLKKFGNFIVFYKQTKHCTVSIGYANAKILECPHFYLVMMDAPTGPDKNA